MKDNAINLFHGRSRRNCSHAIMRAYQDKFGIEDTDVLKASKKWSRGRGGDGICGALYAAEQIVGRERAETLRQRFIEIAQSSKCREIRRSKTISCTECVAVAANILNDMLDKSSPDDNG